MKNKIPFGITFKWNTGRHQSYKYAELEHFRECSDDLDEPLRSKYVDFLNDLLSCKVKRSTLVDVECLKTFHGDLDNRCQIDYREDHWDDDEDITAGGKHFGEVAVKLAEHLNDNGVEVKWL